GEVEVWIKQAELAGTLLGIEDLSVVIPMFMDGKAFSVYDQLGEEEKRDHHRIFDSLRNAFSLGPFAAFEELTRKKWNPGESIEVFLAERKKFISLMGVKDCPRL
ncbi:Uncharacterized protein FKW44_015076, partial [Caligus rogercresseyi]